MRVLPPRAVDRPYRHDPRRTYPLGYTLADLGPRNTSTERHRDAEAPDEAAKEAPDEAPDEARGRHSA